MSQPTSQRTATKRRQPAYTRCPRCPRCQRHVAKARDYFCPACQTHLDDLYRAEHLEPERAKAMSRADIEREYEVAGHAFAPVQLSKARLSQLRGVPR